MKKIKKLDKKILNALKEKAELSTNKGRFDNSKSIKPNSKTRRHSGRKEIYCDDEDYPTQLVYYDDWLNYRDGFRDKKNIKDKEKKKKIREEKEIRKIRKRI
jgi:hypothetical protein